ncbi:hypothetical protein ABZ490_49525 [Streptomyces sp. NPDC005811]|uniref:hypothetical protein n=1 Tax=Streptomyces sp. NPDC005811 TaxID=3154565 RepID=UPI003408D0BE
MEELASRLGLSKSSIDHHVSGKEELLALAVTRALDALFAVLGEPDTAAISATGRPAAHRTAQRRRPGRRTCGPCSTAATSITTSPSSYPLRRPREASASTSNRTS